MVALIMVTGIAVSRADDTPKDSGRPETLTLEGTAWLDLTPDASLKPWAAIEGSFFEKAGAVRRIDRGVAVGAGAGGTGIRLTRTPPTEDYEITFEARRIEGDDFFCGLTFPVGASHVTLILGGWGGGLTGLSNVDGYAADENNTTGYTEFRDGVWVKVRLRVTKTQIEAWLGDEKIVEQPRGDHRFELWWQQEAARPLGLTTWKTAAEFRDLKIRRLVTETKPSSKP